MAHTAPSALRRQQELYLHELNDGNGTKMLSFTLGDVWDSDGFGGLHANGTVIISIRRDPGNRQGYATCAELLEIADTLRRLAFQLGKEDGIS